MIRLHLRSVVDLIGLAREILTIPARRTDDLIDRALVDADGLAAHLLDCPRDPIAEPRSVADLLAEAEARVADLKPVTAEDFDFEPLPPLRRWSDNTEAFLADWAAEVDTLADVELADMLRGQARRSHPSNGGEAA